MHYQIGDGYNMESRLTPIGESYQKFNGKQNYRYILCKCICGNVKEYLFINIQQNHTKSCGCLNIDKIIQRNTKHNLSQHSLYKIYTGMKTRCYNSNELIYENYGERGIKICQEWLNSFQIFYDWAIQNGWKNGLEIDRINNDGDYEPKNCRFITHKENCNNKSSNILITIFEETKNIKQWSEDSRCVIPYHTLYYRLKNNWNPEEAIIKPSRNKAERKIL